MQLALEERLSPEEIPAEGERGQRIIGAAQSIIWDGQEIFKHVLAPDVDDDEPRVTLRMWHIWRDGFKEAMRDSSLTEECKKVARKAATLMHAIEEGMTF